MEYQQRPTVHLFHHRKICASDFDHIIFYRTERGHNVAVVHVEYL